MVPADRYLRHGVGRPVDQPGYRRYQHRHNRPGSGEPGHTALATEEEEAKADARSDGFSAGNTVLKTVVIWLRSCGGVFAMEFGFHGREATTQADC